MNWFAVKTFYRVQPTGRPKFRDARFIAGIASLEERIVLVRARNGESALKKGVAEAKKYAKRMNGKNIYGQALRCEPLNFAESYEMCDSPAEGLEVFSSIELVRATERPKAILRRKLGESTSTSAAAMFLAAEILEGLRAEGADL